MRQCKQMQNEIKIVCQIVGLKNAVMNVMKGMQYKFNLNTINKLIKMQQNVQSERPIEGGNYSQQRNSIPSKIPDSDKILYHNETLSQQQNYHQLQIAQATQQKNHQEQKKLKQIDHQIQREKQLIEKLRQQNQKQKEEIQHSMNKSYLSLSPHHLQGHKSNDSHSGRDELLQTQTQADFSFLENRKNIATKQLQTQEEKYRENIRKMQLKKSQIKRRLKQDQQIPIRIMDFKELQRKKGTNQDEQHQIQKNKSINKQKQPQQKQPVEKTLTNNNDSSKKQPEKLQDQTPIEAQLLIQTNSKKPTSQKLQPYLQAETFKHTNHKQQHSPSQKQSQLTNKSKVTANENKQKKENYNDNKNKQKVENDNDNEKRSRISSITSSKKYSVKKSSVIVPEFNQSIREIQERREIHPHKTQSQKTNSQKPSQQIKIQPGVSSQYKSRASSIKKSEPITPVHSEKQHNQNQNQQKSFREVKTLKESIKPQIVQDESQNMSDTQKQKSVRSSVVDKQSNDIKQLVAVKEKTLSVKSKASAKKQQKIDLMYIPHAPKPASNKSFKKTDKSIQWSEVDMSIYGKTNEVANSHENSQLLSELNHIHPLIEQTSQSRLSNQIQGNKINMKKIKLNEKTFFQEVSQKQKKSEKSVNLEPIKSNKQKSESSFQSKMSQNQGGSFAASRQGSVKQKSQRYNQFHKEHSLNNKKIQNTKLGMFENNKVNTANKPTSYRSRKSNPISNLSVSRSKPQTEVKNEQSSNKREPIIQVEKNKPSELGESKVLISKEEINILHAQIKKLEEKLLKIQEKQQKLTKEKQEELVKLKQIEAQQAKLAGEPLVNQSIDQNEKKSEKNEEIKIIDDMLIPEHESVSKELIDEQIPVRQIQQNDQVEPQQNKEQKPIETNQSPIIVQIIQPKNQTNNQISFISERNAVQDQINQLAEIQLKFTQEKQELLDEINKLKKVIRDMQIQKIKSIEHDKTILIKDDTKNQRPQTQTNDFGVIVHQNKKNITIQPILIGQQDQSNTVPVGKIVKNQSPQKNTSRLTQNLDSRNNSIDRKFRINISKKSSTLSDHFITKHLDSPQISGNQMNSLVHDEDGNQLLQKNKKQSYPINAKQGYVVLTSQKQNLQKDTDNYHYFHLQEQKEELKLPQISDTKFRKAQVIKDQILQKFHRTNKQFNNFIESSRIINQTNSSMSSHNNFFFDKTHQSGTFSNKKADNHEEEDNPQNAISLNKLSSSNIELKNDTSTNQLKQNFTRIVDSIKNQALQNDSDDQLPEIEVRDLQMPQLSKTPDITYDQNQLMKLAQQTFKIFDIEVNYEDEDFNMKKYKNCVIFTKGMETILWHYNGKFYIGGWKGKQDGSGQKTGEGIQIVPDKHIYKGQFMKGKKHGTGIMKTSNGNIYDGQWIEGIKNGQGVYYQNTTKVVYQGEWKDGKKNGFGILKFSQKQYYKGTFVKSVKDGFGIQVFINGDKYRGEYRKGKFHGKGKYTWANTSVFQGDFYEGMRHGNGCWKSAKVNGDIYVGTYQNDKKSGYGRYVWSNGCIYEGNFSQDVKHGKGRLIYTDGKQIKGIWEEGSLLEAVTSNPREHNQEQVLKRAPKIKIK